MTTLPEGLNDLWALEHSQHSEAKGMYPWHIGTLKEAIDGNLRDCQHNERGANKWQIVYIGPDFVSCQEALDRLTMAKGKKEFVFPASATRKLKL